MKKIILSFLILIGMPVCANELVEDYFDIASNYCTYGQYKDAMIYVDKIIQLEPSNVEAKELKNTLLRIMNPNIESYLSTVNKNLQEAEYYKNIGDKAAQVTKLASAQNDFWSNYLLAELYRDSNDFQNSISYYQKAISLKPAYSQSYLGLAKAYIGLKDYPNAISSLDKYLEYNKNSDIAYAMRSDAKLNMNYILEAEEDIKNALAIEENLTYLLTEAKILYYKGRYEIAKKKLTLLSANLQTSEVYKYMGLCDYAQGDYPSALLNLDKAIILSDEDKTLFSTYNDIKMMLDKK